jgi:hypothetical protein
MSNPNMQETVPFKDEDLEEMIKSVSFNKTFSLDRGSRKILLELAQVFLEEVLDLSPSDKQSVSINAISRQMGLKFPEISR